MPTVANDTGNLIEFFNPGVIPYAIALLVLAIAAMRLLDRGADALALRVVRHRLVIKQVGTVVSFVAYIGTGLAIFSMLFNLSSQALFAISGTVAVTVGFALKDVAASFMAGISILINKPFQVGDRITFGGFYGEVTEIGLRTVRLVTLDDNLVTIPSNKFLTDAVASANAGALDCMVVMPFYISTQADHARARDIVRDAVLASKFLYLGKPMTVLVGNRLTEQGRVVVELAAKAYVFDTRHEKAFSTDVTDRVLRAFREHGIAMPG